MSSSSVPRRMMGKTGESISIVGLGGIAVMSAAQAETDELVGFALDHGVNYFDVAPSYGHSEDRLGPALEKHRDGIFLSCKTLERCAEGAAAELRSSLKRLRTDHLDLYQMHALNTVEDVDEVLRPGGAMDAFVQAREQGLIRFIGFSGHTMRAALNAISRFDFDTVMFPVNWISWFREDFGAKVIEAATARNMGISAIKAAAVPTPLEQPVSGLPPKTEDELAEMGLRFALSQPISTTQPRGHAPTFRLAVHVAEQFSGMKEAEIDELRQRSADFVPRFKRETL